MAEDPSEQHPALHPAHHAPQPAPLPTLLSGTFDLRTLQSLHSLAHEGSIAALLAEYSLPATDEELRSAQGLRQQLSLGLLPGSTEGACGAGPEAALLQPQLLQQHDAHQQQQQQVLGFAAPAEHAPGMEALLAQLTQAGAPPWPAAGAAAADFEGAPAPLAHSLPEAAEEPSAKRVRRTLEGLDAPLQLPGSSLQRDGYDFAAQLKATEAKVPEGLTVGQGPGDWGQAAAAGGLYPRGGEAHSRAWSTPVGGLEGLGLPAFGTLRAHSSNLFEAHPPATGHPLGGPAPVAVLRLTPENVERAARQAQREEGAPRASHSAASAVSAATPAVLPRGGDPPGFGPPAASPPPSGGAALMEATLRNRRSARPGPGAAPASGPAPPPDDRGAGPGGAKNRSSRFRGVTKHRRSGRWEAHLWVKELGRQVYLGGYEHEEHAAEAYDVAALKSKGRKVKTNYDISRYADLTECMDSITLDELIMAVRRQSQGFARGTSNFRGVTAHPSGRWEARIGVPGSKHIYLGLFESEQEAAKAYDRATVRLKGTAGATNFAHSDYRQDLGDFHTMQARVLTAQGPDMTALLGASSAFERWIKHGSAGMGSVDAALGLIRAGSGGGSPQGDPVDPSPENGATDAAGAEPSSAAAEEDAVPPARVPRPRRAKKAKPEPSADDGDDSP